MKAKNSPPLIELEEYFEVDESSPSGLRWKKTLTSRVKIGDTAGHLTEYYSVVFKKLKYRVHRIVYQLHNKIEILSGNDIIDHVDGNRVNNSPSNLRLVNRLQNRWNSDRMDGLKSTNRYHQIIINLRVDEYTIIEAEEIKQKIINDLRGEYSVYLRK